MIAARRSEMIPPTEDAPCREQGTRAGQLAVLLLCSGLALGSCSNSRPTHPSGPGTSAVALAASSVPVATGAPAVPQDPKPPAKPPEPVVWDPCDHTPKDMACIPAGPFIRGLDDDPHKCQAGGQPPSRKSAAVPSATITLDTYYIDLTEVTNAAHRQCAERGDCKKVKPLYYDYDGDEQAITGISWFDADIYCRAMGRRLPTEAEWEKAARGPDGELNPFGNEPVTCDNAVIQDRRGRSCGVKKIKRGGDGDRGRILPVKSRPAGRYGLYDMVGNAEEWVADWWTKSWTDCGEACQGHNPKGPCDGVGKKCPGHRWKSVRGGSWYWPAEHATGYHRRRHLPANKMPAYHHFGFRCAADPPAPPPGVKVVPGAHQSAQP